MFKKILEKIKYKNHRKSKTLLKHAPINNNSNQIEYIPQSIDQIKTKLNDKFSNTNDFIIKTTTLQDNAKTVILITYIEGMIDLTLLNDNILKPVMDQKTRIHFEQEFTTPPSTINILKEKVLTCSEIGEIKDFNQSINDCLSGKIIIFVDGIATALSISLPGVKSRDITEPLTDAVVRGPREGFTELLQTNKTLIRRRIKNVNLKFEYMTIGKQTSTMVVICYIKGIANEQIIQTVRKRLRDIDTDAILESGYLEAYIEDTPIALFPTVGNSEKPDTVCGKLLEGRVAILCDGTPFVLTVPYLFVETLQTSEDYYQRSLVATLSRIVRIFAIFISINLPAIYLTLICFHQEVIPFKLLITMASSREGVPYSAFAEALFMLFTFELLREAGVRMPRPAGSTVSIVGALVLGQSAVQAGLVSTPMIIVTAITAISGSTTTPLLGAIPIIRLLALVFANSMGFLGIFFVNISLLIHLCTITSFYVPYLSPFTPISVTDLKDAVARVPIWAMFTRPKDLTWGNADNVKYRQKIKFRKKEE